MKGNFHTKIQKLGLNTFYFACQGKLGCYTKIQSYSYFSKPEQNRQSYKKQGLDLALHGHSRFGWQKFHHLDASSNFLIDITGRDGRCCLGD